MDIHGATLMALDPQKTLAPHMASGKFKHHLNSIPGSLEYVQTGNDPLSFEKGVTPCHSQTGTLVRDSSAYLP